MDDTDAPDIVSLGKSRVNMKVDRRNWLFDATLPLVPSCCVVLLGVIQYKWGRGEYYDSDRVNNN